MYTIRYNFEEKFDMFENLTANTAFDKDVIIEDKEFLEYLENQGYERDEIEEINIDDLIEKYLEDYGYNDKFFPMIDYAHILQYEPKEEQIKKILDLLPDISVVYLKDLDSYALTLNACGSDLSYQLEAAYYLIDGISPIKSNCIPNDEVKELIETFRNKQTN
jgi:hypothetical protein